VASLSDAASALGSRPAVVARELTKIHEETVRGDLAELRLRFAGRESVRGECVVVAGGAPAAKSAATPDVEATIGAFEGRGMTAREVARAVARETGVSSREVYRRLLERKR
jgi:16S rRNA (cytidine1402-2'-O)-methyltransferase